MTEFSTKILVENTKKFIKLEQETHRSLDGGRNATR